MTPGTRPRVLVVEDHALVRSRVTAILSQACDIVGVAEDGTTALRDIGVLQPDVVVLDVSLPDMSGLEVVARLRRAGNTAWVVFLSAYEDDGVRGAAQAAGGDRYIVKSRLSEILAEVLGLVAERSRRTTVI
jgi:DNA-binding NarL/FixJ family response regulator